ncbi:MAG: DUF4515 domain-containing protein [Candidatus Nanohaloarchaea archaeon]
MEQSIITLSAVAASSVSVAGVAITYYKFSKEISRITSEMNDIKDDVNSLEIENRAFEDTAADSEENMFENNVRELAEKLFTLLKKKHGVDDVTTYKEMTEAIRDMDAEDDELKNELIDFYQSVTRLEYSDDKLPEDEKESMKRTAIDLIKKTGQSL